MRLNNYTTMETPLLRDIIKHCLPSGVAGFDIAFKNSYCYHGKAYVNGCHYHNRSRGGRANGKSAPYVVIDACRKRQLIGLHPGAKEVRHWRTPFSFTGHGAYLAVRVFSHEEAMVVLVAHELRHLWQKRVTRGRRVYGSRGQYSARDADAYALQKLREWRRT